MPTHTEAPLGLLAPIMAVSTHLRAAACREAGPWPLHDPVVATPAPATWLRCSDYFLLGPSCCSTLWSRLVSLCPAWGSGTPYGMLWLAGVCIFAPGMVWSKHPSHERPRGQLPLSPGPQPLLLGLAGGHGLRGH